jgi:hypothetical protein
MTDWKVHDDNWLMHQEQLAPDRWLLCFITNPTRTVHSLPDAWVNVLRKEWTADSNRVLPEIEVYKLDTCGPLEMECIMHEMRNKYKP